MGPTENEPTVPAAVPAMQSLRSGPFSRRVFNNDPMVEVDVTEEAEGDCMYVSIMRAMQARPDSDEQELHESPSIESLRASVASAATDDMLQQYQQDQRNGLTHTEFMDHVNTLPDLQNCIRKRRAVWGDSHSLSSVATAHQLVFLLWSEPLVPLHRFNAGYPFVAIPPPPLVATDSKLRYVLLQHTRREHYNLIRYNGKSLFLYIELPPIVKQRWAHVWNKDGKTMPDLNREEKKRPVAKSSYRSAAPAAQCNRAGHRAGCQCHRKRSLETSASQRPGNASARVASPAPKKKRAIVPSKPAAKACGRKNHNSNCQCHVKHKQEVPVEVVPPLAVPPMAVTEVIEVDSDDEAFVVHHVFPQLDADQQPDVLPPIPVHQPDAVAVEEPLEAPVEQDSAPSEQVDAQDEEVDVQGEEDELLGETVDVPVAEVEVPTEEAVAAVSEVLPPTLIEYPTTQLPGIDVYH